MRTRRLHADAVGHSTREELQNLRLGNYRGQATCPCFSQEIERGFIFTLEREQILSEKIGNVSKLIVVVQSLSHVWLFATPWTAELHASLSFTISRVWTNWCPLSQWCYFIISMLIPWNTNKYVQMRGWKKMASVSLYCSKPLLFKHVRRTGQYNPEILMEISLSTAFHLA